MGRLLASVSLLILRVRHGAPVAANFQQCVIIALALAYFIQSVVFLGWFL